MNINEQMCTRNLNLNMAGTYVVEALKQGCCVKIGGGQARQVKVILSGTRN